MPSEYIGLRPNRSIFCASLLVFCLTLTTRRSSASLRCACTTSAHNVLGRQTIFRQSLAPLSPITARRRGSSGHQPANTCPHRAVDEVLDEDLDIFDLARAYRDDGRKVHIADVPVKITRDEVLDAQRYDDFCQTILARQDSHRDSAFFEDDYGILRRRHPAIHGLEQIVLPETLRPRILDLAHYSKFAGHPGQTSMYRHLRGTYYWPQMAADVYKTVRTCNACAKNRVKLLKRMHPLRLFPARSPLEALSIDILGPLTKTKKRYRFLLVVTDRFTKPTQVIPL